MVGIVFFRLFRMPSGVGRAKVAHLFGTFYPHRRRFRISSTLRASQRHASHVRVTHFLRGLLRRLIGQRVSHMLTMTIWGKGGTTTFFTGKNVNAVTPSTVSCTTFAAFSFSHHRLRTVMRTTFSHLVRYTRHHRLHVTGSGRRQFRCTRR